MHQFGAFITLLFKRAAAIEPENADRAVIGQEFADLAFDIGDVFFEVGIGIGSAVETALGIFGGEIGIVPVRDGIIETEFQAGLARCIGQFLHRIAMEGSRFDDVKVGEFGAVHAKAVMVFGGDDDVFHAGAFGDADPFAGIEVGGIELGGEFFVFGRRYFGLQLDPFGVVFLAFPFAGGDGVDAPMNEHAEPGLVEPGHPVGVFGRGEREGEEERDGEEGRADAMEKSRYAHDE